MGKFILKIEDFQKTASENDGYCLTKQYLGLNQKMDWLCSAGHQFTSRAEDVRRGSWCRECSKIKKSKKRKQKFLNKIKNAVHAKDGVSLSKEYVDKNTKVEIKCSHNHLFKIRPHDLLRGHWCAKCAGNAKFTIKNCQEIALKRNGRCLSKNYINSKSKLLWECSEGHKFETCLGLVKYGYWCPYCKHKTESICREVLEEIFDSKFVKIRPSWLVGINGYPLELDGYCEELNLAFEYNGIQHYKPVDFFGGFPRFEIIKKNDFIKKKLCKENGVNLLVIEHIKKTTRDNIKEKIIEVLIEEFSDC